MKFTKTKQSNIKFIITGGCVPIQFQGFSFEYKVSSNQKVREVIKEIRINLLEKIENGQLPVDLIGKRIEVLYLGKFLERNKSIKDQNINLEDGKCFHLVLREATEYQISTQEKYNCSIL